MDMIDIDFKIHPDAVLIATERVYKRNKLKTQIQVCINGGVCPKCAKDIEKHIDDNRNIIHICKNCGFVWPQPEEKLKILY